MEIYMRRYALVTIFLAMTLVSSAQTMSKEAIRKVESSVAAALGKRPAMFTPWLSATLVPVSLDRVVFNPTTKRFGIYFASRLRLIPMREQTIADWTAQIKQSIASVDPKYADYGIRIYAKTTPVENYIPNVYRRTMSVDKARKSTASTIQPLVTNSSKPIADKGLSGRHIALWSGHGYYYKHAKARWEWQRAKLFGTVEDLNTLSCLTDYLIPMLENAGAVTVMPKERDPRSLEFVVDNDGSASGCELERSAGWSEKAGGFKLTPVLNSENPFTLGSYLSASASRPVSLTYRAAVTTPDEYGVYVSWKALPTNLTDVAYRVTHSGGTTDFVVNQRIGGGTWVYLGRFRFDTEATITVSGYGEGTVTSDAVRIGGGMGNVRRGGSVSDLPRYMECSRYYMQYSGIPASVYSQSEDKDDYQDDYKSRGDWVNYMRDNLGVPIDLSFALHTDAGICDSVFGTMAVCYHEGSFVGGGSRATSRDYADIVQSQVVDDMRKLHEPTWTRRMLFDKRYSESWRPNVPAMILELLSHQNDRDMRYFLDPQVRFDISRSIYKGILRYLADRYDRPYVVQPLAPTGFAMDYTTGRGLKLSWQSTVDPLEPTARADRYMLYMRRSSGGFDNGTLVEGTSTTIELPTFGDTYGFRVTAVNAGGESFPSETLTAHLLDNGRKPALVVNGFTRISAPTFVRDGGRSGVDWQADLGVPSGWYWAYVGHQYDYNPSSAFVTNDSPGWGASDDKYLGKGLGGNTFDYTGLHGEAFVSADIPYISTSASAFDGGGYSPARFSMLDIYFGTQKPEADRFTIYDDGRLTQIARFKSGGIPVLVSGAYLGREIPEELNTRVAEVLSYRFSGSEENQSTAESLSSSGLDIVHKGLEINGGAGSTRFAVGSYDILMPTLPSCKPIIIGGDNSRVVGVFDVTGRSLVLTLPLEASVDEASATEVLGTLVAALGRNAKAAPSVRTGTSATKNTATDTSSGTPGGPPSAGPRGRGKSKPAPEKEPKPVAPTPDPNETIRYDKQSAYPVRVQ